MGRATQTNKTIAVVCNKCKEKLDVGTERFYSPAQPEIQQLVKVGDAPPKMTVIQQKKSLQHRNLDGRSQCEGTLSTVDQRKPKTSKPSRDRKSRGSMKG